MSEKSLYKMIKTTTGQDVYRCRGCQLCDILPGNDMDVPLTTILNMVMFDDEEVLTCRTVWSDRVLEESVRGCKRGLKLQTILLAIRSEAKRRGIVS